MSTEVVKAVSKKLKYYFEIKRLEDGFDLSGPDCPRLDHPPLKSRPTLMYDGLHDRPLKHYFTKDEVKQALTSFKSSKSQGGRQKQVKNLLESYMRKYQYKEPPLSAAYYRPTPRGGRRLKNGAQGGFGSPVKKSRPAYRGGNPVLRSVPPSYTTHVEANRLVNVACKILLATESADPDKDGEDGKKEKKDRNTKDERRGAPKSFESEDRSRRNSQISSSSYTSTASSEPQQQKRPQTSKSKRKPQIYTVAPNGNKVFIKYQEEDSKKDKKNKKSSRSQSGNRGNRGKHKRNNRRGSKDSESSDGLYTIEGEKADKQEVKPWLRREVRHSSADERDSFVRPASPADQSGSSRPVSRGGHYASGHLRGRSGSQSSLSSASSLDSNDPRLTNDMTEKRDQNRPKSSMKTQTGGELLKKYDASEHVLRDGERVKYRVHVFTGDKMGAATKADIKLELVGDKGRSDKLSLAESRTHKVMFQKGQEDVFDVDSVHVGNVRKIFIGHDRKEMGTDWFLDRVIVKDMEDLNQYDVPCTTWLSSRAGDKRTYRDFNVGAVSYFRPEQEKAKEPEYTNQSQEASVAVIRTTPRVEQLSDDDDIDRHNNNVGRRIEVSTRGGTSNETQYSERKASVSSTETETTTTYTATTTNSEANTERKEVVSPRGPPPKRRDDFFDKEINDKDYSSVIESLSVTTDQDNHDDFNSGRPTYTAKDWNGSNRAMTVTPVAEQNHDFDDTAHLQLPSDSEDDNQSLSRSEITTEVIHRTTKDGDFRLLKKYLDEKPDLKNSVDSGGWTLLHTAASKGHTDITQWLSVQVVDLEAQTPTGNTAIHLAASNGHIGCMRTLYSMGATLDSRNLSGETPLHLAAISGELEIVKYLVFNGANVSALDKSGQTAADAARDSISNGASQCQKYLEQHMDTKGERSNSVVPHPPATPKPSSVRTRSERPRSASSVGSSISSTSSTRSYTSSETTSTRPSQMSAKEREKHDNEIMEKKRLYNEQQSKMASGQMSFLDSIRSEVN